MFVTFFLIGYFVCDYAYNNNVARYNYHFNTEATDVTYLIDASFFSDALTSIDEYNAQVESGAVEGKKISYAAIDYQGMLKSAQLAKTPEGYSFSVLKSYFPTLVRTSNGTVNQGNARCKTYLSLIFGYAEDDIEFQSITLDYYQNPFVIGAFTTFGAMLLIFTTLGVFYVRKRDEEMVVIEDNKRIFRTPFHKDYWRFAASFFSKVKNISTISILFALMMICKLIPIPSGFGSLGLGFTYLVFALITMCYGPLCGLVVGFLSDILGFFLFQGGQVFFPGYTLDAMLAGFVYGLCFYRTKVSFVKCLTARFFVNIFVNVLLGSIWWKIIYQLDFNGFITYMTLTSLPKNILYLLPQSILLYLLFRALAVPLTRFGLIEEEIGKHITLF